MNKTIVGKQLSELEGLIGEWRTEIRLPGKPSVPGRSSFEWGAGRTFLLWRSTVEHRDFPDSISVIGAMGSKVELEMHYYDTRGVHRVVDMTFAAGVWTLSRKGGPGDFDQRFAGTVSSNGRTIAGAWEKSDKPGSGLKHDFDVTYTRINPP